MKILNYLYYRYYKFQVKVGNRDIAPFSAMLIIAFTMMLYYFSLFFIIIVIIPKDVLSRYAGYMISFSIPLFLFIMISLYNSFIYKSRYKKIIKMQERLFEKNIIL